MPRNIGTQLLVELDKSFPHCLQGKPRNASIVGKVGPWFVSIVGGVESEESPPHHGPGVAIDRGAIAWLVDSDGKNSDGKMVPNPAFGHASAEKVATAQHKAHRQHEHLLYTLSYHLTKSHGIVVLEDLRIVSMTASTKGRVEDGGRNVARKVGLNRCSAQAHADVKVAKALLSRRTGGERVPSVFRDAPAKQKRCAVMRGTVQHDEVSPSLASKAGMVYEVNLPRIAAAGKAPTLRESGMGSHAALRTLER